MNSEYLREGKIIINVSNENYDKEFQQQYLTLAKVLFL